MYLNKRDFENAYTGINEQINKLTQELKGLGESRLICRRRGDKLYFVERRGSNEKGITQDLNRIKQLTKKEYLLEELKILKSNLKPLKYCMDHYNDISEEIITRNLKRRYTHLPVHNILVSGVEKWMNVYYKENDFYLEDKKLVTNNGTVVRSKSEREIANALEAAGLTYKYDVKIEIDGIVYYVDFLIYRADGTIVYWEHFGLENNRIYMAKNRVRIEDYIHVLGLRPWNNLIWTLDSDLEDINTIRMIIDRFLLHY